MNNADEAHDFFIDKFLASYDDIPNHDVDHDVNQNHKVVSNSYKPWLTKSLIHCINRKNYLYSKFCKRSTSANEFNFKTYTAN